MATMTVSSKGQIVLPADIRRRLGFLAGSQVEVIEQPDGVRLVASHPVKTTTIAASAGIVTAPSKGKPRRLEDFDSAMLMWLANESGHFRLVRKTKFWFYWEFDDKNRG